MKKIKKLECLVAFVLVFLCAGCLNNFETQTVENEGDKGEISDYEKDPEDIYDDDLSDYTEQDLQNLVIDIFRKYNSFFMEHNHDSARYTIDFNEEQDALIEKFNQLYPEYVKCLQFFLSFLRIDDYEQNLYFDEKFTFEKCKFSQIKAAYNLLKNHYQDNFNSDYYFPSYDEVFVPYEDFMNILDEHTVFNDFDFGLKASYENSKAEVLFIGDNSCDVKISDFNAFLSDIYKVEKTQLPIRSIECVHDMSISSTGDYSILKDCIKDINLDGTLQTGEKISLLLEAVENAIINYQGEWTFSLKDNREADIDLVFEPEIYLEKTDLEFMIETLSDKKLSPLGKLNSLGELPVTVKISVVEKGTVLFSKDYTFDALLELYRAI